MFQGRRGSCGVHVGCIDCFSEGLKDSGPTGIQLSQALPLCPCLASYELLVQQMRILAQQAEEFWAFFDGTGC